MEPKNIIAKKVRMEPNRMTAKKVQTINEVGMKPNHMTANNVLAINKVGMDPNHLTAKYVLAINEEGMEPNHTTEKKQAKTAIKNKKRLSNRKTKNWKYNILRVHFTTSKFMNTQFLFLFDLEQ
jgi:hypothetical protein